MNTYPKYYKEVEIADNLRNVVINKKTEIEKQKENSFSIYKNKIGAINKIVKHGINVKQDVTYRFSNKGNLKSILYSNGKYMVKDIFDYTKGQKDLIKKKFYKNNKYVKCELFNNGNKNRVIYYNDNEKYYCEFFNSSDKIYPYKVEYYNKAGLKVK